MTDYRASNMIWRMKCDNYNCGLEIEQIIRIMSDAITIYFGNLSHTTKERLMLDESNKTLSMLNYLDKISFDYLIGDKNDRN